MHYLDTSVLVAYYYPEPRSLEIQRIMKQITDPTICPLVEVELYCAMARKVRAREMDAAAARRIFSQFETHLAEAKFQMVPIRAADYTRARGWIEQLDSPLRVLDALHLAVASAHGLCLVTADKELALSARHFGARYKLVE